MLGQPIATFPESKLEQLSGTNGTTRQIPGNFLLWRVEFFTVNVIYINISFNAIKHLEYSIGRNCITYYKQMWHKIRALHTLQNSNTLISFNFLETFVLQQHCEDCRKQSLMLQVQSVFLFLPYMSFIKRREILVPIILTSPSEVNTIEW